MKSLLAIVLLLMNSLSSFADSRMSSATAEQLPEAPRTCASGLAPVNGVCAAPIPPDTSSYTVKRVGTSCTGGPCDYSNAQLQTAINAAASACGWVLKLHAAEVFNSTYTLPSNTCSAQPVVISTDSASCPASGTRVTAANASAMPKITGNAVNTPTIATADNMGNGYYWLICVEVTLDPSVLSSTDAIVRLGSIAVEATSANLPKHVFLDRVYIHGPDSTHNYKRGVELSGNFIGIINSLVNEIHYVGADAQAVWGSNADGPMHIANNRLEGTGENMMFGGAQSAYVSEPCDLSILGNYFFKPLTWDSSNGSFITPASGGQFTVKNLLEFKTGCRVLVQGNVLENSWRDQLGNAIVITPKYKPISSPGDVQGFPITVTQDIDIRYNWFKSVGSVLQVTGIDVEDGAYSLARRAQRIRVKDNVILDVNNRTVDTFPNRNVIFSIASGVSYVTIEHNTAFFRTPFNTSERVILGDDGGGGLPLAPFIYRNNIQDAGYDPTSCNAGSHVPVTSAGVTGCFNYNGVAPVYTKNVFTDVTTTLVPLNTTTHWPSTNQTAGTGGETAFPVSRSAVGFNNLANCLAGTISDCALTSLNYRLAGTDSKDLGADITTLLTKIANVRQ